MAVEALAWPAEPTLTDAVDTGETYNMGGRFSLAGGGPCPGVRWRVPGSVTTPPVDGHVVAIWRVSDQTRIAAKTFVPTPGGYQDVLFDTPVTLLSGVFYVVSVYTQHYVFRNAAGLLPVSSPSGNIVMDEGRLASSGAGSSVYPNGAFSALYYVSPLIGTVDGGTPPSAAPTGLAIPAVVGSPAAALARIAAPVGQAVPIALGTPTAALSRSASPTGLGIGLTLGQPSASRPAVTPSGLPVTVAVGAPTTALARNVQPTGISVGMTVGSPKIGALPSRTVIRPDAGSVTRPDRGTVTRP